MQALTGEPRESLDPVEVAETLSLVRGASVRHGVDVLDATDTPTGEVLSIIAGEGSVTWSYRAPDRVSGQSSSVSAVRRRATLTVPGDTTVNLSAVRLRVWTEWLMRDGRWARFYLGVFVVVNPGAVVDDGTRTTRSVDLADKAYLWANRFLAEPLFIADGVVVTDYVKADLQTRFGETRFALPTSTATLPMPRTFEAGTSLLDVYSRLLEAVGFDQLTADEIGRASAAGLADIAERGIEHTYAPGQGKIVTSGQVEPLQPTLPNVVRFSARQGPSLGNVEGNGLRTVRNQSSGPASIDARGGVQVELRVDVEADTQAVLDAIAAADAQRYFAGGGDRFVGSVGLNPRHSDRDVVSIQLPRLGVTGVWNVTEWTYPLGTMEDEGSALMPITAERRVVTA